MRVFLATIVGLTALATTAISAAPVPSNAHSSGRSHETPAENVRKSQWYDHLLSTNASFRTYRTDKECDPIVNDRDLRTDCIRSFDQYEPFRPRVQTRQSTQG
jgi:hypothetical protein